MSQELKMPNVFHLNNWPNESKIINNVCRCNVEPPPQDNLSEKVKMIIRVKKTRLIAAVVGLICFSIGLAIPFLYLNSKNNSAERPAQPNTVNFVMMNHRRDLVPSHHKLKNDSLQDVFISVKTTKKYHYPRVVIQLETWVSLVKSQTWFFTDSNDAHLKERTNGHLIATNCSESHSRVALACKMSAEFDTFLKSHKPWWCHFDDDNYVHVLRLSQLLQSYSSDRPVYLGKPSTAHPIEIWDLNSPQNVSHFWFATGGAGFCVTRTLALKMAPYTANGKLVRTGEEFWFPDDVTLGYIIEHLLKEKMTVVQEFHSHLEPMKNVGELDRQISLSHSQDNVIALEGPFSKEVDPTRFYSLHCHLYGGSFCPA